MLIKLEKLIAKYNMKISGVIHVGAHWGEEANEYYNLGIKTGFFFEPCKDSYNVLVKYLRLFTANYHPIQSAIGSDNINLEINKTNVNHGQSNSLLKPKKHLEYYPDITFEETEEVQVNLLDNYHLSDCNFLNVDVQGYEMEVLKGATATLRQIDYIYLELNREELYEGCAMVEDIDNYLTDFTRVKTRWLRKGYGDGLYIRKTLL